MGEKVTKKELLETLDMLESWKRTHHFIRNRREAHYKLAQERGIITAGQRGWLMQLFDEQYPEPEEDS